MSRRWLITGGAGFIGVNLARALTDIGDQAVCFDDFSTGSRSDAAAADYHEVIEGSILDPDALRSAVADVDVVVHLAAQTGVQSSLEDPLHDHQVNVLGSLNVLEACRGTRLTRVIVASSAAPIGRSSPPMHEKAVARPISPYGASKLACESYVNVYADSFGVPAIAVRFSNVYGPWCYHKGSVVARFFGQVTRDEPLTINGSGEQTRDFVHVDDLARALVSLASYEGAVTLFQLGTGVETTILDLARMVNKVAGRSADLVTAQPALPGDVARSYADISLAVGSFGYDPAITLDKGLPSVAEWFTAVVRQDQPTTLSP